MDFQLNDQDLAFQDEVRDFLERELPAELSAKVKRGGHLEKEDFYRWQRILYDRGWIAPAWPVEYGGTGWTPTQRYIFERVCADAWAPTVIPFGLRMVGPVIYTFGTDEQKARYLPRILSSDDFWCQGYSEPGSGSDLASLRSRAEDAGDHYLINGQKTWTSQGHWADMMFMLVRTDPNVKPQQGITFLLVDMKSPGITVRPIITLDGWHYVNEVFFEDVHVPKENRIGEEGKGWTYAKFLLGHERTGIAGVQRSRKLIGKLKESARNEGLGAEQRARIGQLELDLMALEYTELRVLTREQAGQAPGPEASLLKIKGSELTQAVFQLSIETLGYHTLPYPIPPSEWGSNLPLVPEHVGNTVAAHLYAQAATIFGGSNEIQRGIIAKSVLGL